MATTARATAKKAATKKLTRNGAAGPVTAEDTKAVEELVTPSRATKAAAVATDKLVKGRPGRKSHSQQAEEVLQRLVLSPAERNAFADQLERHALIEKLVALRNDAGLSQRELAEKIGSHQPDIGKIENGHVSSVAALQRYARGLGAKLVISIER